MATPVNRKAGKKRAKRKKRVFTRGPVKIIWIKVMNNTGFSSTVITRVYFGGSTTSGTTANFFGYYDFTGNPNAVAWTKLLIDSVNTGTANITAAPSSSNPDQFKLTFLNSYQVLSSSVIPPETPLVETNSKYHQLVIDVT